MRESALKGDFITGQVYNFTYILSMERGDDQDCQKPLHFHAGSALNAIICMIRQKETRREGLCRVLHLRIYRIPGAALNVIF
jgi:hypothetical protein